MKVIFILLQGPFILSFLDQVLSNKEFIFMILPPIMIVMLKMKKIYCLELNKLNNNLFILEKEEILIILLMHQMMGQNM